MVARGPRRHRGHLDATFGGLTPVDLANDVEQQTPRRIDIRGRDTVRTVLDRRVAIALESDSALTAVSRSI